MTCEQIIEELVEFNCGDEVIIYDDLNEALVGICEQYGKSPRAIYDYEKCIKILMSRDGMDEETAIEFFEYNTLGAYTGETTPAFIHIMRTVE